MNELLVCDNHVLNPSTRHHPKCPAQTVRIRLAWYGYTAWTWKGTVRTDAPMYVIQFLARLKHRSGQRMPLLPPPPDTEPVSEKPKRTYRFDFSLHGRVTIPADRETKAREEFKLELEGMIAAFERYIADPVEAHHELVSVS